MSTIVLRSVKGTPLTNTEVDTNFSNLNTDKVEKTAAAITGGTINGTSVGATTASTGAFTTLSSTGNTTLGDASADAVTINGTVQPGVVISGTSTGDALRITQLGTGNALLVEDSANPDSTPLVVDANGRLVVGSTAAINFPDIQGVQRIIQTQVLGNAYANSSSGIASFINSLNSGGTLTLAQSRNTTIGSHTIVSPGDTVGAIQFAGSDGTNFIRAASIAAAIDGTPGTNDMPGRLVLSTTADGASTPTERVRIDSTGQTKFSYNTVVEVSDATNAALRVTQLGTGNALLVEDSTNPDSTPFVIDASGRVIQGYTTSIITADDYTGTNRTAWGYQGNSANTAGALFTTWNTTATSGAGISLSRSKSATVGTQAIVSSGDSLGGIGFNGDDGVNFISAASITAAVDGTPGTNDMPGRLVFSTTADGASTPAERVRITNAGDVGFGVTAPATKLDVLGTIQAAAAATQDAVRIAGRAGGTGSFAATITTDTLAASVTHTLPAITGTLATLANTGQTFTGQTAIIPTTNSATITIGAIPQTGTITVDRSQATHTLDVGVGPTLSGNTKTINFGTAGVSGSITTIIYGSSISGATVTHTFNSGTRQMQFDANGLTINNGSFEVKTGPIIVYCPTPSTITATATLTNADIQAQIINTTGAAAYTVTLPLGTDLETLISWDSVDIGYDFYLINSVPANITIAANTGVTIVGRTLVATNISGQFRIRRTAANTFIVYRIN